MGATAVYPESGSGAAREVSIEPRGDGLDDLREALRRRRWYFNAHEVLRLLDRYDDAARKAAVATRPETVGTTVVDGKTHVVLRCHACGMKHVGPTQDAWFAAPLPPSE